jgi:hypothetical protein
MVQDQRYTDWSLTKNHISGNVPIRLAGDIGKQTATEASLAAMPLY